MSLIQCPECEKNISSNAKQCPHCGCIFQMCPECEAVLIGEHNICPKCGFHLISNIVKPTSHSENSRTLTQWYELSKTSVFVQVVNSEGFRAVLRIISFILAAIAIFLVYNWSVPSDINEALSALANTQNVRDTSTVLLILGAVIWVVASLCAKFGDIIFRRNFDRFATTHNLNLKDLIDAEFKQGFNGSFEEANLSKRVDAVLGSIRAIQTKEDVLIRIKDKRSAWLGCVGSLLFATLCCIFAVINVENYMQHKLLSSDAFGFDQLEYIWLPIAGVVLLFIFMIIENSKEPFDCYNWMKKNMPQHMKDYDYYFVQYDKRVDEHLKERLDQELNKD